LQAFYASAINVQLGRLLFTNVISIPPGQTVAIHALSHVSNPESVIPIFESGKTFIPGSLLVVHEPLGHTNEPSSFQYVLEQCMSGLQLHKI